MESTDPARVSVGGAPGPRPDSSLFGRRGQWQCDGNVGHDIGFDIVHDGERSRGPWPLRTANNRGTAGGKSGGQRAPDRIRRQSKFCQSANWQRFFRSIILDCLAIRLANIPTDPGAETVTAFTSPTTLTFLGNKQVGGVNVGTF